MIKRKTGREKKEEEKRRRGEGRRDGKGEEEGRGYKGREGEGKERDPTEGANVVPPSPGCLGSSWVQHLQSTPETPACPGMSEG